MPAKPQKTEAELAALLMAAIRRRPKLAHIKGVGIERPVQFAPYHPNWRLHWITDGPSSVAWEAEQIGRDLQNQFDLKFPG